MINETVLSFGLKNYLKKNIKANNKILILISCGLDSTVLFDLIKKSKYFINKNIYYLIFDHQKRSEGKYEIKQFIKYYKLSNKNLFIKKVFLNNKLTGFQNKSRLARYKFLYNFSKKRKIENIFLGHHLDDLNETFFMRKIQQSSTAGLSRIFLNNYKSIKLHRPLKNFSKKQIRHYADKTKLIWFEDRSNLELEFTRNKIRYFLNKNNLFTKINRERLFFSKTSYIQSLHKKFFIRKKNKIYEIDIKTFNNLTENLKFLVVQSFYYEHRNLLKKQIRDENIMSFIAILRLQFQSIKKRSVFSGKIGVFNRKICLNLN